MQEAVVGSTATILTYVQMKVCQTFLLQEDTNGNHFHFERKINKGKRE